MTLKSTKKHFYKHKNIKNMFLNFNINTKKRYYYYYYHYY